MHILYICKTLPESYKGGIQTHIWELSKQMIDLGHKVFILTSGSYKIGYKIENIEGRTIYRLPYIPGRRIPLLSIFFEELFFNLAAFKWLKKFYSFYDIIHLQGRSGFLFPSWAIKRNIKNLVITYHSLIHREFLEKLKMKVASIDELLHAKYIGYYERLNYKCANRVIAVSDEAKAQIKIETSCDKKAVIIPNGIIPSKDSLSLRKNEKIKYFTFIGRFEYLKGAHHLPKVATKLLDNIRIVMIGGGPLEKMIRKEVKRNRVEDKFIFTGMLDSAEVNNWISKSFAVIQPSHYETQGIAIMEANNLAKPVIVSKINAFKNVVISGFNGVYLKNVSSNEIAKSINRLAVTPERAETMGQFGKNWIHQMFNWKNIAIQTESLYYELAS